MPPRKGARKSTSSTSLPQCDESPPPVNTIAVGPAASYVDSGVAVAGVTYDMQSCVYVAECGGERVGVYPTEKTAAMARDIYVLRHHGGGGGADMHRLNYRYDVVEGTVDMPTLVRHPSGVQVQIRKRPAPGAAEDSDVLPPHVRTRRALAAPLGSSALVTMPFNGVYVAGKTDVNRKWQDRVGSAYMPTAAFTFDVTFPPTFTSLGLQLRPHLIPFSLTGGHRALSCCVVLDAQMCPTSVVWPGDLLLSVNGTSLITEVLSLSLSLSLSRRAPRPRAVAQY